MKLFSKVTENVEGGERFMEWYEDDWKMVMSFPPLMVQKQKSRRGIVILC